MTAEAVDPAVLEPVTARAWRPAEETRLGDWRLNAALGVSGRINACWPMGDAGEPPPIAIASVEAWYAARGMPARFKLVDGHAPPGVEPVLQAAGYGPGPATLVMTGPALGTTHVGVTPTGEPDLRFSRVFAETAGDPLDARERLEAFARTPRPRAFALAELDGAPAAIGACAVEPPWVGIFAMRTIPAARGRGLAGQVLDSLMAHAQALGARTAWLQVEADNATARRLYARAGFGEAYAYRYWRRT